MKKPIFTQNWFTASIPTFNVALGELKGKPGLNYLEIGTFEGRSVIWMLDNILTDKDSRATCIDDFSGVNQFNKDKVLAEGLKDRFLSNMKPYIGKYRILYGKSDQILRKSFEDNTFDIIYIDGDHEAHSALMDAVFSMPLLKPGGVMIFDDYMWNWNQLPDHRTPKIAIDAILGCFKNRITVVGLTWKAVVIKKIK